jgi:surface protein
MKNSFFILSLSALLFLSSCLGGKSSSSDDSLASNTGQSNNNNSGNNQNNGGENNQGNNQNNNNNSSGSNTDPGAPVQQDGGSQDQGSNTGDDNNNNDPDDDIVQTPPSPPAPFITKWRMPAGATLTLPLVHGYNYNFTVDWGDGSAIEAVTASNDPKASHTYNNDEERDYTVTIEGTLEAWSFMLGWTTNPLAEKLIEVENLGTMGWKYLRGAFAGCKNLIRLEGLSHTNDVTDMSHMFYEAFQNSLIENLDISSLNTQSVTTMDGMFVESFRGASEFASINLNGWDLSSVETMKTMFSGAFFDTKLQTVDLSSWNTSNVKNMQEMFYGFGLESLDLSSWDVSSVTDMNHMFGENSVLKHLNLSGWNIQSVTNIAGIFWETYLTTFNITGWTNTNNITHMCAAFFMYGLEQSFLDLRGWDFSKVEDIQEADDLFFFDGNPVTLYCPGDNIFGYPCDNGTPPAH